MWDIFWALMLRDYAIPLLLLAVALVLWAGAVIYGTIHDLFAKLFGGKK
jgi:hypothetical protein